MDTPDPDPPGHKTNGPPLSAREIRFCQYLVTDDTSRYDAYTKAGFPPKVTRQATDAAAYRLVKKRQIREYIRLLQHHAAEAARVTVEELAALVRCFALADLRRVMDSQGRFLPLDQWPDDVAVAVESMESEELYEPVPGERGKRRLKGHVRKVKLVGKMSAAARLMEWKRMTGGDKDAAGKGEPPPLVVGGEASPDSL